MAAVVRLDTHVVVWLYTGETSRLSERASEAIEASDLLISPIVELELTYLHEIGRLSVAGAQIVNDLSARIGLQPSSTSMLDVVHVATGLGWTRDPFDRLIVADASAAGVSLVTKDATIREHFPLAMW